MPNFIDIHYDIMPRYRLKYQKVCGSFIDKFAVKELTYSRLYVNGDVIDLPIYSGVLTERYIEDELYLNEPLANYKNILNTPVSFVDHVFRHTFCQYRTLKHRHIYYYTHMNLDRSISLVSIMFDQPQITDALFSHQSEVYLLIQVIESLLEPADLVDHFLIPSHINPNVHNTNNMVNLFDIDQDSPQEMETLTQREIDIACLIMNKYTDIRSIADALGISYRTCEDYIGNLRQKLYVSNIEQLALLLHQNATMIRRSINNHLLS